MGGTNPSQITELEAITVDNICCIENYDNNIDCIEKYDNRIGCIEKYDNNIYFGYRLDIRVNSKSIMVCDHRLCFLQGYNT